MIALVQLVGLLLPASFWLFLAWRFGCLSLHREKLDLIHVSCFFSLVFATLFMLNVIAHLDIYLHIKLFPTNWIRIVSPCIRPLAYIYDISIPILIFCWLCLWHK